MPQIPFFVESINENQEKYHEQNLKKERIALKLLSNNYKEQSTTTFTITIKIKTQSIKHYYYVQKNPIESCLNGLI